MILFHVFQKDITLLSEPTKLLLGLKEEEPFAIYTIKIVELHMAQMWRWIVLHYVWLVELIFYSIIIP